MLDGVLDPHGVHGLAAVVDTAVRDKAIAHNPAHAVRRPKVTANEAAYMTPDQVRSLLAGAEGSRYAPLFALLVNSGLRSSSVFG